MKKKNFVTIVVFILLFVFISQNINTFGGVTSVDAASATKSDTRIYYNIDMSSAVLASRINQKVGGDCGVVSMATIEAYLYGAKNTSDKDKVYNALVKKNTSNNSAEWSKCGYTYYKNINWETVYDQLSKGYPVIVHRPAQSSTEGQHWAVVAGYKGSTTKLEKDKFIIVDVYRSGKHEDIVTSKAWRGSVSIDKMVTRKNGISITSLSGIRMAIDHPSVVQKKGVGHGVLGYIASNENLTYVNVKVTDANTEKNLFIKTVNPNAKSYLIFNLDSEMTFAKWPAGEYFFTVIAKTATKTSYYQKYFTIDTAWPLSAPTRTYKFYFNSNGGSGDIAPQEVDYEKNLTIPTSTPKRSGYKFVGWTVLRKNDNESFYVDATWKPNSQTDISVEKKIYKPGETYNIKYPWIKECFSNKEYTFYAMWEKDASVTPPSAPTAEPTVEPTIEPTIEPTVEPTTEPTAPPTENPEMGDADGNGVIEARDATYIRRCAASGWEVDLPLSVADLNKDGIIDAKDVTIIRRKIAKGWS